MRSSIKITFRILCGSVLVETIIYLTNMTSYTKTPPTVYSENNVTGENDARGSVPERTLQRTMVNFSRKTWGLSVNETEVLKEGAVRRTQSSTLTTSYSSTKHVSGNSSVNIISAPPPLPPPPPPCPDTPPTLVGVVMSNQSEQDPTLLEEKFSFLKPGGDYHPPDCTAQQRTAIIIPYRDRWIHLHILLYNLIPFLVRQQASFTIFVIELAMPTTFNRALLLNVGVLESLKRDNYTCFIFHDVDLVPLDDHNLYRCGSGPRHLAVGIDKFKYRLPYGGYFGGASALSRDQVFRINGNSNLYFGWGGEDDDSFYRVNSAKMKVSRYPVQIARYRMIRHERDKGNAANPMRAGLLETAARRMAEDGLSTVTHLYTTENVWVKPLYTWVTVTVNKTHVMQSAPAVVQPLFRKFISN